MKKQQGYYQLVFFFLVVSILSASWNFAIGLNSISTRDPSLKIIDSIIVETVAKTHIIQFEKSATHSIESVEGCVDSNGNILYYLCKLSPQGFIIVSNNFHLPPIFGYSFINEFVFDPTDTNSPYLLINDLIHLQLCRIDSLDNNKKCNIQQWITLMRNDSSSHLNGFQQWPPEGTTPTGGWLETNWHQNAPYKNLCPMDLKAEKRSVAGCPAIAMAQILNFHRTTNDIRFNDSDDYFHNFGQQFWIDNDHEKYDFPSYPDLNCYLVNLTQRYRNKTPLTDIDKAALVFACGTTAKQVYSGSISGTFKVQQAYDAYLRFGINRINLLHEDDEQLFEILSQNMKSALPAHLAVVTPNWDAGHNLVVDGYNTNDYYHLNFGWGGNYNGWYILPEEIIIPNYELTVIEGVIVNILKRYEGANLECSGSLIWSKNKPDEFVTGSFVVENIGEPGSDLNWEIESYPQWGNWSFSQMGGQNLSPEDGTFIVNVSVISPNIRNQRFTGGVKIVNSNTPGDCCYIQVILSTPRSFSLPRQFFQFANRWFYRYLQIRCFCDNIVWNYGDIHDFLDT